MRPGVKGISLFLVPKFLVNDDGSLGARNDLVCASIEHKMGIHGSPTAVMAFGEGGWRHRLVDRRVQQGPGLHVYDDGAMPRQRRSEGVGSRNVSYQHALAYARERVRGNFAGCAPGEQKPILHHPGCPPHADGHEVAHGGYAHAGLLRCRRDGPRPCGKRFGGASDISRESIC